MLMSPGGGVDGVNDYVNDGVVDRLNGYDRRWRGIGASAVA